MGGQRDIGGAHDDREQQIVSSPPLSADGRYALYDSAASDLTATDTNGTLDVFLFGGGSG